MTPACNLVVAFQDMFPGICFFFFFFPFILLLEPQIYRGYISRSHKLFESDLEDNQRYVGFNTGRDITRFTKQVVSTIVEVLSHVSAEQHLSAYICTGVHVV